MGGHHLILILAYNWVPSVNTKLLTKNMEMIPRKNTDYIVMINVVKVCIAICPESLTKPCLQSSRQ